LEGGREKLGGQGKESHGSLEAKARLPYYGRGTSTAQKAPQGEAAGFGKAQPPIEPMKGVPPQEERS